MGCSANWLSPRPVFRRPRSAKRLVDLVFVSCPEATCHHRWAAVTTSATTTAPPRIDNPDAMKRANQELAIDYPASEAGLAMTGIRGPRRLAERSMFPEDGRRPLR
jgi:hypothetical protein